MNLKNIRQHIGWTLDTQRIQRRFERVEQQLRQRDISHLSPALQAARQQQLDRLHRYWQRGKFPRNYDHPRHHAPCFIDRHGAYCAVAYLLKQSGQTEITQRIAIEANYATVREMAYPELETWAVQSGLTVDEVALIQPTYGSPHFVQELDFSAVLSMGAIFIGVVAFIYNFFDNLNTGRRSNKFFVVTVCMGVALLLSALVRFVKAPQYPGLLVANDYTAWWLGGSSYNGLVRISIIENNILFHMCLIAGLILVMGGLSFIVYNNTRSGRRSRYVPDTKRHRASI